MAITNPILFNAALSGSLGGSQQRWITNPTQAAYTQIQAVAVAIATSIDEALGTQTNVNSAEADLMQSITQGIMTSRYPSSDSSSDYDAIAAAVVAMYLELKGGLDPLGIAPTGDPNTLALFNDDGLLSDDLKLVSRFVAPFSLVGVLDYRTGGGSGPLWNLGGSVLDGFPESRTAIGLDVWGATNHPSDPENTYRRTEYRNAQMRIREGVSPSGSGGTNRFSVTNSAMQMVDEDDDGLLYAEFSNGGAGKRLAVHGFIVGGGGAAFQGSRMVSGSDHPNVAHDIALYNQGSIYMRDGFYAAIYVRTQIDGGLVWVRVASPQMVYRTPEPGGTFTLDIADVDGSGNLADVVYLTGVVGGIIDAISNVDVPDGHKLTINYEGTMVQRSFSGAIGAGEAAISSPGNTTSFDGQMLANDVVGYTYDKTADLWRADKPGVVT